MLRVIAVITVFMALVSAGAYYALVINVSDSEETASASTQPGTVALSIPQQTTQPQTTQEPVPEQQPQETLRIVATGDIIAHDSVTQEAKNGDTYDYAQYFDQVAEYMDGDLVICTQDGPSAGSSLGISGYPVFNTPKSLTDDLTKVGCNTINLATNNINDKEQKGITQTLAKWDSIAEVNVTGAASNAEQQNTVNVIDVGGVKVAHVAFTESSNKPPSNSYSVNVFSESLVKSLMKKARESSDYIIVSAHWGDESSQNVTASQEKWAKLLSEQGANIVFGSGSHVLQKTQKLTSGKAETLVYFGLGNTLGTQLQTEELIGGIAIVDIVLSESSPSMQASLLPTYMHYEWSDAQQAARDYLSRKNLGIHPLEGSDALIKKSQLETSEKTQMDRVTSLLNTKQSGVTVVKTSDL